MKTMITSLTLTAMLFTSFCSCSDDNNPVLTQKDWDGTATYLPQPMKTHSVLTINPMLVM